MRCSGIRDRPAPRPTSRSYAAGGPINGVLHVVGGSSATGYVGTLEAYDPANGTWKTRAAMPTPRSILFAKALGGMIYAVGGSGITFAELGTVEAYQP